MTTNAISDKIRKGKRRRRRRRRNVILSVMVRETKKLGRQKLERGGGKR